MEQNIAYAGMVTRLLNAATATGAGTAFKMQLSAGKPQFPLRIAWQKLVAGTVESCVVDIEGSLDGTNYFALDTINTTTAGLRFISDKPVFLIRANLTTISGSDAAITVDIVPNCV